MGHGFDECPQCGCDLWHEYSKQQRLEQMKKHPDDCHCFTFEKRGKRDITKDTFIETRTVNCWTGPLKNTHEDRELKIYKCHICGKEFDYPQIIFA